MDRVGGQGCVPVDSCWSSEKVRGQEVPVPRYSLERQVVGSGQKIMPCCSDAGALDDRRLGIACALYTLMCVVLQKHLQMHAKSSS